MENTGNNTNEVAVIRVALPKTLRGSGKTFGKIQEFTLGRQVITDPKGKAKIGKEGVMTLEDWNNKNYAPYGLTEYFATEGKAQLSAAIVGENSALQDQLLEKDAEIAKLKAALEASASASSNTEPLADDYSGILLPELKEIAKEKGIDITGLKKDEIIQKLQEHAGN